MREFNLYYNYCVYTEVNMNLVKFWTKNYTTTKHTTRVFAIVSNCSSWTFFAKGFSLPGLVSVSLASRAHFHVFDSVGPSTTRNWKVEYDSCFWLCEGSHDSNLSEFTNHCFYSFSFVKFCDLPQNIFPYKSKNDVTESPCL